MTTTDTDTAQDDVNDQAGHPGPASDDANHPPASEPDAQDEHGTEDDTDDQDDDTDDGSRTNREKRYRLRLRDAERERNELADTLTRTRQAIVSSVVAGSGYAPRVAELVAADMDQLLDDNGIPDAEKIVSTLAAVVADYGFARQSRPPHPSPAQGHQSGQLGGVGKASWADAIKGS